MKKIFSIKYSAGAVSTAALLLRLIFGGLMLVHGYDKLITFDATAAQMPNFLGLGKTTTASLVIFAEFFCSIFLILGLFTRLATIPLIICMSYIIFILNKGKILENAEIAILFLAGYIAILLIGAGRASLDGLIGK